MNMMLLRNRAIINSKLINPAFTMVVDTTKAGSAADTFIIPLRNSEVYDFTVDWGDGVTENVAGTGLTEKSHTYSVSGTYTIKINGIFPRILFNNGGDKLKLMDVSNWGNIQWGDSLVNAFYGCTNATFTATDAPNFCVNCNISGMFRDCVSFNNPVNHWDTSNVEIIDNMFRTCSIFNQPLSNWDTSNIIRAQSVFFACNVFDQDISNWNVENIGDLVSLLQLTAFSNENYDKLLVSWASQNVQSNVSFHAGTAKYSSGEPATARDYLANTKGWTITDGGLLT